MAIYNMDYSNIAPDHFFSSEKEKTHFNWFAFELASEIDRAIPSQLKKLLLKRGYTKQTFNRSCIELAKLLQNVVLKRIQANVLEMQLDYTDIEKAFPNLDDKTIDKLQFYTGKAWELLLDICISCPCACITNKDDYCPMFDDSFYYETPTGSKSL